MIGIIGGFLALILLAQAAQSFAQPPTLSKELVRCRELRILARQARDLGPALVQLGIPQNQAKEFLIRFQQKIDECETASGHELRDLPAVPEPSGLADRLRQGPVATRPNRPVPEDPRSRAVDRLREGPLTGTTPARPTPPSFGKFFGPHLLAELLDRYQRGLVAQCGATPTIAQTAPTRAIFNQLLDRAAFGTCSRQGPRGSGSGQLP
jgi:hypothetical protein